MSIETENTSEVTGQIEALEISFDDFKLSEGKAFICGSAITSATVVAAYVIDSPIGSTPINIGLAISGGIAASAGTFLGNRANRRANWR